MSDGKPTIFFSHSAKDGDLLNRLKDWFNQSTGNSFNVFLSSDGQSIPLGRNWVHSITAALDSAKVMFVFLTPNSLHSGWLHFESGYVHSKNKLVVPVGLLGVDMARVPPPMGLLQGFNIGTPDALGNIVAVVNREFRHSHTTAVSNLDYDTIFHTAASGAEMVLGDYAPLVRSIKTLDLDGLKVPDNCSASQLQQLLREIDVECKATPGGLNLPGTFIDVGNNRPEVPVQFTIEPMSADHALPVLARILQHIRDVGVLRSSLQFEFDDRVGCVNEGFRISGRLVGTGVSLENDDVFVYDSLTFTASQETFLEWGEDGTQERRGPAALTITFSLDEMPLLTIFRLVDMLFKRGVLAVEE